MIIVGSASDFLYEENKVAVVTFFFFFNPFQCEVYLDN
jgi:hypothetical protein